MTKEEDAFEEIITKILDAKLDAVLKPILAKLDAEEKEESDEEKKKKKKEAEEKKDSISIATDTLRAKLDGLIPAEDLKTMSLVEMSTKLAQIQNTLNPSHGGNLIHVKKDGKDIFAKDAGTEMIWEA